MYHMDEVASQLPTPSTDHIGHNRVYDPAEDSYLMLGTLSSDSEKTFLRDRFASTPSPLVCEIGAGSGISLALVHAHSKDMLGRNDVLTVATDLNYYACKAVPQTVAKAAAAASNASSLFLGAVTGDLASPLRSGQVDVLIFNPPYVPCEIPEDIDYSTHGVEDSKFNSHELFERESGLLALAYAGGDDGMQVTNRFLEELPEILNPTNGVAYLLLCLQNKPEEVQKRIESWPGGWTARMVGHSGNKAGWEILCILRICRKRP